MTPSLTEFLDELEKLVSGSYGDCDCCSSQSCDRKAEAYWNHFDVKVPILIQIIRRQQKYIQMSCDTRKFTRVMMEAEAYNALADIETILKEKR